MKYLLLLLSAIRTFAADPVPLQDLKNWTTADGKPAPAGWMAEPDGTLHRTAKAGDLFSAKEYGDFELTWEWKIAPGGNSGVKYRVTTYDGKGLLGPEYQLLDDEKHADSKVGPHRQTGALYDLTAPDAAAKKLNPPGEWNESKIIVRGNQLEHWLNGTRVVAMEIGSEAWKTAHAKSKFKNNPGFATNPKGRIMLQDHGDEVWFRKLSIRELE
jgi:Domain of Unknown Function (DUF1080)